MFCSFFVGCQKESFNEDYIINASISTLDSGEIKTFNLALGTIQSGAVDTYSSPFGTTKIIHDNNSIYLFENNTWEELTIAGYEIKEKPVKISEVIYFVSPDPEDDSEFPDRYIWTYQDGKIERFSYAVLDINSAILTFDNVLIYVEGKRIVYKDIASGEQKLLVYGEHICWYEIGKSFFYNTNDGELAVFYIDTCKRNVIDEKINMLTSPVYDSYNNVLLLACDNPKNQFSYTSPVLGFYYLDSNHFIQCDDYFKYVDFQYQKDFNYSISKLYWN